MYPPYYIDIKSKIISPIKASKKYLFNKDISINNKKVEIKTVENFDEASDANINIKFTTINKLHSDTCSIKENNVNIESLKEKKVSVTSR